MRSRWQCYLRVFLWLLATSMPVVRAVSHDAESVVLGIVENRRSIVSNEGIILPNTSNNCTFAGKVVLASPFSLNPKDRFFVLGSSQLVGYTLMVDYINRHRCGIGMRDENGQIKRYAIDLRTFDDHSSTDYSLAIAEYLASTETHVDLWLGGYSSGLTEPLAKVASDNGRLLLSPGAAATSVFAGRTTVFGTQPPSTNYITQAMQGLSKAGAKRVATVWEDATFTRGICSSAPSLARLFRMRMTSVNEVVPSPNITVMETLAMELAEQDPDIVVTCVYDEGCQSWMKALRNINWSPKAQVFTVCVGFQEFERAFDSDATYIMGVTPWDSSLQLQDPVTGWSAQDFAKRYLAKTADEDVKYQAASAAAVISIAVQAIEATSSLNDTVLADYVASNSFQTIYGEICFDENGQSKAPASLIQYDVNGTVQSVFPKDIASGSISYPMPTWNQRDCKLSVCESEGGVCSEVGTCVCHDHSGEISVGAGGTARCIPRENMNYIQQANIALGYFFFSLIIIMCIGCLVWVYWYQANPLVKVSQPLFMVLLVIGCMISAVSIILLGVDTAYRDESENIGKVDAACMAVPWLWGIGFGISFSAIFAKVRRVKKIYDTGMAMKREPVLVRDVVSIMVIVVLCEVVILTVWQIVSPHRWQRTVQIELDGFSIDSVGRCNSDYGWWFFLALVIFNVFCLLYAVVLCFKTKHLPSEFAESSHIFLAVMFLLQILLLAVPVLAMVRDQTQAFHFIRIGVIFLQNFTVLVTIFGPKIYRIYTHNDSLESARKRFVSSHAHHTHTGIHRHSGGIDVNNDGLSDVFQESGNAPFSEASRIRESCEIHPIEEDPSEFQSDEESDKDCSDLPTAIDSSEKAFENGEEVDTNI